MVTKTIEHSGQTLDKKIIYVDIQLQNCRIINDLKMRLYSIALSIQNLSLCIIKTINKITEKPEL
jgi:hypothetical protein